MKKFIEEIKHGIINNKSLYLVLSLLEIALAIVIITNSSNNENTNVGEQESIVSTTEHTKTEELELLYHQNSKYIIEEVNNYISEINKPEDYSDEVLAARTMKSYIDEYLTDTSDYSDYRYDLEIDIFIDLFKTNLIRNKKISNLIERREVLFSLIQGMSNA